ncbi:nitroreductase family protein [Fusibacter ferrireducens]|uniref:Nitroreductase family protein n=1 Tax=Fusibacter ferrireducens TaxID=2785058 RepID=A0ABR9ZPT5_9FIRM|nr:nitroreductase family protein [Fusibacter ferrireducens]MBF4692480.1 nitroreductase family protein [Fusibacter ferrireducens]
MTVVNCEKCIGCGLCVKDCIARDIKIVDQKAVVRNVNCMNCGHCIAICPQNAVTIEEYNMEEVKAYSKEHFDIESETLLNFIKYRRSVRQFKAQDVESKILEKIIEAGRFTQTGINMQDVSYAVIKSGLPELRGMTLESLKNTGEYILANLTPENKMYENYARMWIKMYTSYQTNPEGSDFLFFNAPVVIVISAKSEVNGALAASNMELMANALGLGTFFSGFLAKAAHGNAQIRDFLQIKEGKEVVCAMVIGHPAVKYKRTVPRKQADITWM